MTLVLSKEKPVERKPQAVGRQISALVRDKNLWVVIAVITLYKISQYAVTPFLGTYQNKELGFTLTVASILGALYSVVRSLFSRPIGRLADKTSFCRMLQLCFLLEALAYLALVFTGGAIGRAAFVVYKVLNAISMAGINSGSLNLVYDYVAPERRVGALALQNTVAGMAGFLTTLVASSFVDRIQANGNIVLGIPMYAQQALSFFSALICLLIVVYLRFVVGKSQKVESTDTV
jgi:MFS family permease